MWKKMHGRNPSRESKDGSQPPVRVGGRVKKAKTIFDPSDTLYPRKRRMSLMMKDAATPPKKLLSSDETSGKKSKLVASNGEEASDDEKTLSFYKGWCLICLKDTPKLISCQMCTYKAHVDCLKKSPGANLNGNKWHCPQCKYCSVCRKTAEHGILTQCRECLHFYHNTCHRPRIITKNAQRNKWMCSTCKDKEASDVSSESGVDESAGSSGAATPAEGGTPIRDLPKVSKGQKGKEKSDKISANDNEEKSPEDEAARIAAILAPFGNEPVPDASAWTANEVYTYFLRHFPNEAEVFREQEIDGASLLLMKRDDVVSGLKLKLGPAIRIYRRVLMLQKRSSDPRLSWA